ncbi:response regulator [Methylobacterium terricola]|uniref:Response regulator n=1 Tax=Methylobacterium terricola TaxID=2583531 RepID=A0A5C4LHD5_9HYPH|nr:response regulator [Methylobacterium terricola]TNC12085.1 response regulator [Methylobacterium terricola]
MLDSVRISLKVLNAAQLAGVAAAAFGLAWFGGALSSAPRQAGTERPALVQAARAYADALDEELGAAIGDARNAALLLRLDDSGVSDAWRAARLQDWLSLNPRYRDAVLLAPDGTPRASGGGTPLLRIATAAPARRAEIAITAGPDEAPFALTLALGLPGRSDSLVLRAAPAFFDGIGERIRRGVGASEAIRDGIRFAVAGADGRALLGVLPAADDPRPHEAAPTRGSRDLASPGWLVTASAPGIPVAAPAGADPRLIALGLALVLGAGGLGYALGGRVSARLRRLADDAPGDGLDGAPVSRVREIAAISGTVRDRTLSLDARLAGAGSGLDRVRGRLTTFEAMSGWTCWEIDPETRQVVWSDRASPGTPSGTLAGADRVATMADLAARFEPADRPLLDLTLAAALAADGPHDVALRLRGPGSEAGGRLLVRFLRGRDAAGRVRVHALSRAIREGDAPDTPAGANERRRNLVLRRVTDGIVHDFNDVLTVVLANLGVLRRQTALDARQAALTDAALAGAHRGAALTRRLLGLVRGGTEAAGGDASGADLASSDLAATVAAFLPFLQANVLREAPLVTRIPDDLPRARCGERLLELVLLNLAFHVRDLGLHGFAIGAAAHPAGAPPLPGMPEGPALRILFASGRRGAGAVMRPSPRSLDTVAQLVRDAGGAWRLVCDGRGEEAFLAEIWLRAEARAPEAVAAPAEARLRILLVESDSLVRASVAEALGELGHAVVQAASGEHALALLAQDAAFDAMIADQAMPVMTGLQLAATVVERHPGIRVILASPHGQLPAAARRFLQLDKPFRPEDLASVLGAAAPAANRAA